METYTKVTYVEGSERFVPVPPDNLGHDWWPEDLPYDGGGGGADGELDYVCNKCKLCMYWEVEVGRWVWTHTDVYWTDTKPLISCFEASMNDALL